MPGLKTDEADGESYIQYPRTFLNPPVKNSFIVREHYYYRKQENKGRDYPALKYLSKTGGETYFTA